jgi:acid phosphatase type 7
MAIVGSITLLLPQNTATAATTEVVVVAAGDVACRPGSKPRAAENKCMQKATSDLVIRQKPRAVLALGDLQNLHGTLEEFQGAYDPTWGRFLDKTFPVPGNHEYDTPGAAGYFVYFGERAGDWDKGYYSFDLGGWHIVALNSTLCDEDLGGCELLRSKQERWLRADLAAHRNKCTLAYWHNPRFSSGSFAGSSADTEPLWQALYDARAELVLSAHAQHYERFARQDAEGNADPRGMRQFVVGTGGEALHPLGERKPNSVRLNNTTLGVLKLTLRPDSYSWEFVPLPGSGGYTDSGTAACQAR